MSTKHGNKDIISINFHIMQFVIPTYDICVEEKGAHSEESSKIHTSMEIPCWLHKHNDLSHMKKY